MESAGPDSGGSGAGGDQGGDGERRSPTHVEAETGRRRERVWTAATWTGRLGRSRGFYSLLRPEFNTCFGFTEPEVEALLQKVGRHDRLDAVRAWYDGYHFGGEVIYNPWSILSFAASDDALLRNYWLSTSANELIKDLLQRHALTLDADLKTSSAAVR